MTWKITYATLGLALGLSAAAQTPSIGGDYDASLESPAAATAASSSNWDVNDSLMYIPAFDLYCDWNTTEIHGYDLDIKSHIKEPVMLELRHEDCDYTHPFRGRITSNFGWRDGRHHNGIDIKLYKGDPVKVAFEGVVRIARYSRSYGNVVVVRHNNGLETLYAHLSARKVKTGDHVESGAVIGLGGNTGRSTGSHLHFEARYLGEAINPATLIDWENGQLIHDKYMLSEKDFDYLHKVRAKKYHTIRRGETLSAIGRKYGTSVRTLCRLNGFSQNTTIYAGKRIRVR
ncbi:MAG: peptidoglycan DD-metalloendopeptidase family protein [Flavobacteriales bacterium]|nr:peptidoglycan DD-metalloendopeptidase family protein [Flavobacteriales bacterium]